MNCEDNDYAFGYDWGYSNRRTYVDIESLIAQSMFDNPEVEAGFRDGYMDGQIEFDSQRRRC